MELTTKIGMLLDQQYRGQPPVVVEGLTESQIAKCDWVAISLTTLQLADLPARIQDLVNHWAKHHEFVEGDSAPRAMVLAPIPDGHPGAQNSVAVTSARGIPFRVLIRKEGPGIVIGIQIMFVPASCPPEDFRS